MEAIKELAIQFFKGSAEKAEKTLSFVPEDKLNWKPTPTGRSALQIAAHIGVAMGGLASLLNNRGAKPITLEELFSGMNTEEAKYQNLDSVISLLQSGTARVIKALESVSAQEIETGSIDTPFGTLPLRRYIFIPESHTHGHAAQIDYLQTLWGDTEIH